MARLMVNGVSLGYELEGESGPTVVLLNGIAMSIGHWGPFLKALGPGYRILRHDFRGQSLSDKPAGGYSLEGHARDLCALMDALGLDEAHIVGTSYGSEVALAFAAEYPERCATLTVIDGVSELDPLLRAAVESWSAAALSDPRTFYKTLLPWTYSSRYLGENRELLASREDAIAKLPREWFTAFAALCDAFLRIDLTPKLNRITCPSLVLVGEEDILKRITFSETIARGIGSRATLKIIPRTGHAAVIERPTETAAEVAAFYAAFYAALNAKEGKVK